MSNILSQLKTVAKDLNELGEKWALVGALAFSVHAEPRTTRDIDLAVAFEGLGSPDTLTKKLLALGYSDEQLLMQVDPTQRLGVRFKIPSHSGTRIAVDFLFSSTGIEAEIVASASKVEIFPGLLIPVASRAHILAMKILSQNDIEKRGFNRKKDLQAELTAAIQQYATP